MVFPAPLFAFFDLGGSELFLILAIALIFFGGKKLPEVARGLGKAMREFKKATSGIEEEFKRAMDEPPPKSARLAVPQKPPPGPEVPEKNGRN